MIGAFVARESQGHVELGSVEHAGLSLVFGGPVSWWVRLARIIGVKVPAEAVVDAPLLSHAESRAREAGRWFGGALLATTACMVGLFVWSPLQASFLQPYMHFGYHTVVRAALDHGVSWSAALGFAGGLVNAIGLLAGVLDAVIFGGIPLFFLRATAEAASPAVSIALARQAGAYPGPPDGYPRVSLAIETILGGRRRPAWRREG